MKKVLSLALALALTLLFCACAETKTAVDIDAAAMSETMAYSIAAQMRAAPQNYLSKTVRMRGQFAVSHFDKTDKDYYYLVVTDTTACCSQPIEFLFPKNAAFPAEGTTVEIEGKFISYDELDVTYYCIDAAKITVV
ncbi:MAG: hypothetical protein IJU41_05130 [Clostridia bacterium]|nr:hypothetical protein [Clostridia bacterium]